MFAHYAKIPSLIEAIKNGHDVHAATAAMILHIDLNELLEGMHEHDVLQNKRKESDNPTQYDEAIAALSRYADMRSKGKTINFALTYKN